ncbi:MAG: Periplasmic protein [Candidatus Magasanikbacteria bacterium GW2011_GWC2_45_8]|uniref:Periplasmic protein n=1 Tax=Candidatus Magasanikbacteria bacterium GW2011_GWC2_45_8 TaxID=1619050 RepID=A0A0G1QW08_9BACT|nr:MAG: Periplasmic protein [Candidatus Magasanikbacteria bacterium GW2011_GWC2_45_8]
MVKPSLAIALLGGGLVKDRAGEWRTTNFNENDQHGALGDRLRVIATSIIFIKYPEAKIVVLGGKGQLGNTPGVPAVARVIKQELIKLGVPAKKIIVETRSGTTFEQLSALGGIVKRGKYNKVFVVSNEYHLPRIRVMMHRIRALNYILRNARAFSAEKIVLHKYPKKWANTIHKAYVSAAMQRRIQLEKKGVAAIKSGTYKYS